MHGQQNIFVRRRGPDGFQHNRLHIFFLFRLNNYFPIFCLSWWCNYSSNVCNFPTKSDHVCITPPCRRTLIAPAWTVAGRTAKPWAAGFVVDRFATIRAITAE